MTKKLSTKAILEENLNRTAPDLLSNSIVWLHNIRSMHNVGSVFRSSDAFGIRKIIMTGYTPIPPRPEISKTAIGAEEHVEWLQYESIEDCLSELKNESYRLIGLEQTDQSVDLPEFNPESDANLCFVMGNEVSGIDDVLMQHIEQFIAIPQYGHKHSLNVSVATGVLLYSLLEKSFQHQ